MWTRKQQSVTVLGICINENLQLDTGLPRSKLYITSIFSRLVHPKELNHFYRVHNHLLATGIFPLKYMVIIMKHSTWLSEVWGVKVAPGTEMIFTPHLNVKNKINLFLSR